MMMKKHTQSDEPSVKVIMNNPDALLRDGHKYICPHCKDATVLDIAPTEHDTLYCSQCGHAYNEKSYARSGVYVEYSSEFFCPKCTNTFLIDTNALHPEMCIKYCPVCGVHFIPPSLCDNCIHAEVCGKKTDKPKTACAHYSINLYGNQPILSEDEIITFQAYIADAKVSIAFGNTDWCEIYDKIVNHNWSEYAKERFDFYRQPEDNR